MSYGHGLGASDPAFGHRALQVEPSIGWRPDAAPEAPAAGA